MATDQLVVTGVGSYDWTGGVAPAGGTHTGTATITMLDGTTFSVAHNRAEVLRKRDQHASPITTPSWCSFDVPNSSRPIVLDLNQIARVI